MISLTVTQDGNFPHDALIGSSTALVLFCGAFHGQQDAYWVKEAGLKATCVDLDPGLLAEMKPLYPKNWSFVQHDVYTYPDYAKGALKWDVVTLDPWTNQFQKCADRIEDWCMLARHHVVIGTGPQTTVLPPDGWEITDVRKRSDYDGGVYWSVLERL